MEVSESNFRLLLLKTRVEIRYMDITINLSDCQDLKRSIISLLPMLKTNQNKVTLKCDHSKTTTLSNLYKGNSSRNYECKGLFTEEFHSISELQNHQIPKVKTGLANRCNNNWRHLSDSRQSTISFSAQ